MSAYQWLSVHNPVHTEIEYLKTGEKVQVNADSFYASPGEKWNLNHLKERRERREKREDKEARTIVEHYISDEDRNVFPPLKISSQFLPVLPVEGENKTLGSKKCKSRL